MDIKNVEKYGGLENKYCILISKMMSNEKLKLRRIITNNLQIGYSFIGDWYVYFKLIEIDKYLQDNVKMINALYTYLKTLGDFADAKDA